jgi:Baculovirus FP protein
MNTRNQEKKKNETPPYVDSPPPVFSFGTGEGALQSFLTEFRQESCDHFTRLSDELKTLREDLSLQVKDLNVSVELLKKQNIEKDRVIEALTIQVNSLDQYGRKKNIEITNIEEKRGENIEEIVLNLAEKLDVDLAAHEIESAHRLPTRNADKVAPIIVQFASRKKRDQFLEKKKTVVSSNLLTGGTSEVGERKVYINENLAPFYKELFWKTKQRAKDAGYKFVWIKRGRIFVKKNETEPLLHIHALTDLNKICV